MTSIHPADPATDRWHREIQSPVGPLVLVAGVAAIVGLYHAGHAPAPDPVRLGHRVADEQLGGRGAPPTAGNRAITPPAATVALLLHADRELEEYFAGARRAFESPVELHGTAFQQRVWDALRAIPYGETRSYRDSATQLGNPRMGRAIGAAVRSNPVSIIVPGHRVVGSTGAVVGYASGTATKTALLELERAHCVPPDPMAVADIQQ